MEIEKFLLVNKESNSTLKVFGKELKIEQPRKNVNILGFLEAAHPGQDLLLEHIIEQFEVSLINLIDKNKKKDGNEIFEQTLQDINHNLTAYIKEKNVLVDFNCLNGVLAVLINHELYFTYLGKVTAFLIHNTHSANNYKVVDILDNVSGSIQAPTIFKFFSNIISGEIQADDYLIFFPINVLNLIDIDKIKQLITNNSLAAGLNEIKKLLENNEKFNFGITTAKFGSSKPIINHQQQPIKPIENIEPTQKPAEVIEVENLIKAKTEVVKFNHDHSVEKTPTISLQQLIRQTTPATATPSFKDEIDEETIIDTPENISNAEEENNSLLALTNKKNRRFFSLAKIGKLLILVLIIAAIFIIRDLGNKKQQALIVTQRQDETKKITEIENQLTLVKNSLNTTDSATILKNLTNIERLIAQLPISNAIKIQELRQQIQDYSNQVKKITEIIEPKVVAELANPATHLLKANNNLYLYNETNSLYGIDLTTKQIKTIATNIDDKGAWQKNVPDFEENKTLLIHTANGLSQYDFSANDLTPISIKLAADIKVADLNFYGQKLYILDNSKNKIYKYVKLTKNSFGSGTSWVTDNSDLTNTVSLAIDSNIWVLKNNGEIFKFFKGQQTGFSLKAIDPALTKPTKIYTSLELDNLYILEPDTHRLIIIDKLGNLITQITSDKFDNLLDFVVAKDQQGEATGTIYLLNGSKVFEVNR